MTDKPTLPVLTQTEAIEIIRKHFEKVHPLTDGEVKYLTVLDVAGLVIDVHGQVTSEVAKRDNDIQNLTSELKERTVSLNIFRKENEKLTAALASAKETTAREILEIGKLWTGALSRDEWGKWEELYKDMDFEDVLKSKYGIKAGGIL